MASPSEIRSTPLSNSPMENPIPTPTTLVPSTSDEQPEVPMGFDLETWLQIYICSSTKNKHLTQ